VEAFVILKTGKNHHNAERFCAIQIESPPPHAKEAGIGNRFFIYLVFLSDAPMTNPRFLQDSSERLTSDKR
jgi:hypothetical protein